MTQLKTVTDGMDITLIAAVAENGVIGKDGEMPWHHPEDLKHFKSKTVGNPVIMGRVTYESIMSNIGGPLPKRMNVVLTTSPEQIEATTDVQTGLDSMGDGTTVHTARGVDEALLIAETDETDEVFIAGGASVYEQFLPVATKLVITEIHESYEGDTEFPDWDRDDWEEISRDGRDNLSFVTYRRRS